MLTCPRCNAPLDAKGRHLDEEGDPMGYRETASRCRARHPESAFEHTPQRKAVLAGMPLSMWLKQSASH